MSLHSEQVTTAETDKHRHLFRDDAYTRSQCPARCRCGHICPWHHSNKDNSLVGACAMPNCNCDQFADK